MTTPTSAFMVDDQHHGRGIATLLLEHLAAIARSNGITRFTAEVLAENRAMLSVFSRAGWPLQRRFESGVIDLDFELADTSEFLDSVERREQRADSRAISRLLLPRSMAVIGASDTENTVGRVLWRNAARGFTGPLYPVNPNHDTIDGRPAYATIGDVPDDVTVAVVAVPAEQLESVLDQCIAKRVRGAVIVTEVGDTVDMGPIVTQGPAQRVAPDRSRQHGHRVAAAQHVDPGGHRRRRAAGRWRGDLDAVGHARELAAGISPIGSTWASRGSCRSATGRTSRATTCSSSGRTTRPRRSSRCTPSRTATPTSSRASPGACRNAVRSSRSAPGPPSSVQASGALYSQAGLIEVPTVAALLDTARVMACQPLMAGPAVAVVTNSRSPGVLAAAAVEAAGLARRRAAVSARLDVER